MSQIAWTLLSDLITDRTGIYFDGNSFDLMKDKLSVLMTERNISSPTDYYYLLKYDGETSGEWPNVLNAISVRETYFARESEQIRALAGTLVPELYEKFPSVLKIWSAACASGEEPITIATALDQEGWLDRMPIEIYASDFSSAAINHAERGIYRERAFRVLPPAVRDRYFTAVAGGWQIDPHIRRRITWRRANLMNRSDIQELARARVIFCRNVFIYFSEQAIRRVVNVFAELMPSPGYLFLGAAESLLKHTTQFRLEEIGGAFVYVKD